MNLLQTFLAEANAQSRTIVQEAFTFDGDATVYYGTFGDPQIMPVMTRNGYDDHLVTPLKVEASQFTGWTAAELDAIARTTLTRTATGRELFIQVADYTEVVVYTLILTDREV